MANPFIATPKRTKEILKSYEFTFKKSLGQNFIIDVNILKKMIKHAQINKDTGVIEIGPGIGSLTEQLALHAKKVVAFEIDDRLIPILHETLNNYENVKIVHADILKTDIKKVIQKHFKEVARIQLVANLPYYITTPILMHILQSGTAIKFITVMLQKEVAERMAAQPNTKAYGSLSIAVQYYTEANIVMDVPNTVFIPKPNVTSTILNLKRHSKPLVHVNDETLFFEIVRASFAHRRKTIRNNLLRYFKNKLDQKIILQSLNKAEIKESRRAESITINEFARLTNELASQIQHVKSKNRR